jgi:hypothetical protein
LTTAGSIPASENFRKEAAFEPPFSIQKKQGATGITTVTLDSAMHRQPPPTIDL